MVQISHSGENTDKLNLILGVAQKRFGLYGLDKTTMKEIAADLGMSKASLYYYFPDKETLFKAVFENEQTEFFEISGKILEENSDAAEMLRQFCHIRLNYFRKLFNLGQIRLDEFNKNVKPVLNDLFKTLKAREIKLVETILKRGVDAELFHLEQITESAELFIEILKGIRLQVFHSKELIYISPEEYTELEKKSDMVTEIYIRALTNPQKYTII